ncbi:MAG: hypothetical protein K0R88_1620 [Solirubrobacterales bacterium]|nr:hypothetical protein [Solirubrobacterales bacterium]
MPREQSLARRLATTGRWPLGVAITSWRYLWRTTPLHRDEAEGSLERDSPPSLPGELQRSELQLPERGTGPLFHRRYRVRIRDSDLSADELVQRVAAEPDSVAPSEFATFNKLSGPAGTMRVNDEYVVRMASPWDGPVRVAKRDLSMFRLVTLEGHLESGQIEFRAYEENGLVVFEIESWARSKDRLTDLLYDRLRMSKEVQLHMWISTLERIVKLAGGRMSGGIEIHTRRIEASALDE